MDVHRVQAPLFRSIELSLSGIAFPVLIRPAHPMTDEEFMAFAAQNESYRMEREPNGDLVVMTPAGLGTGNKNSRINRWLDTWADEDGRGLSFDSNTGFTMPSGAIRSPDASWLSQAKYDLLSPQEREQFSRVCPEFVIELRSPSDNLTVLKRKMEEWIENGVVLAWLVDPFEQAVTIYRSNTAPKRLDHPTEVTGEGPVTGFVLPLERIFS